MGKKRLSRLYTSLAFNRGVAVVLTAGGGALGARMMDGLAPVVSGAAARGDVSAVGLAAGGIAGFLICASSLKL
jgi:hypothetical protein